MNRRTAHETIAAVLKYLQHQHDHGAPVDLGVLLAVLAAMNELMQPARGSIELSEIKAVSETLTAMMLAERGEES